MQSLLNIGDSRRCVTGLDIAYRHRGVGFGIGGIFLDSLAEIGHSGIEVGFTGIE